MNKKKIIQLLKIMYCSCKYDLHTSKSSPEVSKLSRTMSSKSYSSPGTCLQGSLPEGSLLLFSLHVIFSGELGQDLINSQKWLNYVDYSRPRIYHYNKDNFRFQFLIFTKLSKQIKHGNKENQLAASLC